MSHRKVEHPGHVSLGFLPRKRANRQAFLSDMPSLIILLSLSHSMIRTSSKFTNGQFQTTQEKAKFYDRVKA
ncbi:predicted protein [Arabidopsis lyrata subsp. lyrata]|uniref:Predicted protein n=1 Tax=Arabidopsis lyrata subsp. lyrata TaxID=81972 RepID=D7KYK3_ARALL|nr:predicted protein [Arabidopsis lyrata subsp. lyrata]